jgi:undecaprenyl-diphosphatase
VVFRPDRLEHRVRNLSAIASSIVAVAMRLARRAPDTGPDWPSARSIAVGAAIFAAGLLFSQVWLDPVLTIDPRQLPDWIGRWTGSFSAFGKSGWVLWPCAIALIAVIAAANLARRSDRPVFVSFGARLAFLICAIALPGLVVSIVKPLIGRVRPFVNGAIDPFAFHPLAYFRELFGSMPFPEYFYGSMPSGHTTNAFAIAVAFGALLPRLWPLLIGFALLIAASRLAIGVHHLTDVMVGALFGTAGALAIRNVFAARRLVFAVDAQRRVYAMPGPSLGRLGRAVARLARRDRAAPDFVRGPLAPETER